MNTLFYGDNLDILSRYIKDESVDLVYLDPPFNSKRDYNILFQDSNGSEASAQIKAFEDTWHWDHSASLALREVIEAGGQLSITMQAFKSFLGESDMMAYLAMMAPRLKELHRCLKIDGSLYIHCDPTASHYLKIIIDSIFGPKNFHSEIIWRRSTAHNKISKQYGPIHDVILFYSKSENYVFHPGKRPPVKAYVENRFKKEDERGRYRTNELTGPGTRNGSSGAPWKEFNPTEKGRHWAIPATLKELLPNEGKKLSSQEKLEFLYNLPNSGIVMPSSSEGFPTYRQYISDGVPYQDIWAYQPGTQGCLWNTKDAIDQDVKWLEAGKEKLGFETQKPEGLLQRIIETSTDPGAVVLDPFCGCGTTITVSQKLNRKWIGIDITHLAITLMKNRLFDNFDGDAKFKVIGEPTDLSGAQELASTDPYQFQWWALGLVGARPEEQKKGPDKGIDGRKYFYDDNSGKTKQMIFSVKAGKVQVSHVRDLNGVLTREKAEMGVLISMEEPTRNMVREASAVDLYEADALGKKYPKIQLITVGELLSGKSIEMPYHAPATFKKSVKYSKKDSEQQTLFD